MSDTNPTDRDWTHPEMVAKTISDANVDHGKGVWNDTMVEARADARATQDTFENIYVTLDGVADDMGLAPDGINKQVRTLQQEAKALANWYGKFADALDAIIEEGYDVHA